MTEIELAEGSFDTNLYRILGNFDFTPFISFTSNIQYDDATETWSQIFTLSTHSVAKAGLTFIAEDEAIDDRFDGSAATRTVSPSSSSRRSMFCPCGARAVSRNTCAQNWL